MAPTDINPTATRQVFISGDRNHRLVRVPQNEVGIVRNGETTTQVRETNPALAYQFEDGYLVIDAERRKADERFFEQYGAALDIEDRRPAEEWLREHVHFNVERGFHEIPYRAADSSEALARISELHVADDVEGLVELYEREEAGERRADVLKACAAVLAKLEAQQEAAAAG